MTSCRNKTPSIIVNISRVPHYVSQILFKIHTALQEVCYCLIYIFASTIKGVASLCPVINYCDGVLNRSPCE